MSCDVFEILSWETISKIAALVLIFASAKPVCTYLTIRAEIRANED
jgi:hypothetical protein